MFEQFRFSQESRFKGLLNESIRHLDIALDRTLVISSVYEVTTPRDEMFYVVGYQVPDMYDTNKIYQQFLAIKPETQEIVGFSANEVSSASGGNALEAHGVVASNPGGHYYGFGLEVARQHFFQEVANKNNMPVINQEQSFYFLQTRAWKHFYGTDGVFGYDRKTRKVFQPVSDLEPREETWREGYRVTISKEKGPSSGWNITRDAEVITRSTSLRFNERSFLRGKLHQLIAPKN